MKKLILLLPLLIFAAACNQGTPDEVVITYPDGTERVITLKPTDDGYYGAYAEDGELRREETTLEELFAAVCADTVGVIQDWYDARNAELIAKRAEKARLAKIAAARADSIRIANTKCKFVKTKVGLATVGKLIIPSTNNSSARVEIEYSAPCTISELRVVLPSYVGSKYDGKFVDMVFIRSDGSEDGPWNFGGSTSEAVSSTGAFTVVRWVKDARTIDTLTFTNMYAPSPTVVAMKMTQRSEKGTQTTRVYEFTLKGYSAAVKQACSRW